MNNFAGHDIYFWIAVTLAALFKVMTSPRMSFVRSLVAIFAALFAAWVFTRPIMDLLTLDPHTYTIPVAVLSGLTGEGLMKWSIFAANNPKEALEFLKVWRGR